MKKISILLVFVSALLFSCKSVKVNDLKSTKNNCIQLPALEPRIDLSSLESVYTTGSVVSSSVGSVHSSPGGNSLIGQSVGVSTGIKDKRVQDAITIFDREVKDCLTNPYGEKKGYIVCKFANGESVNQYGFAVLSGLFLFVPNILGMPWAGAKTNIDLDVEIYDNKERLIGRYNANFKNKAVTAFYYGYNAKSVNRITGIRAFKGALDEIKLKIADDMPRIVSELEK
jgi:hypothetical protein